MSLRRHDPKQPGWGPKPASGKRGVSVDDVTIPRSDGEASQLMRIVLHLAVTLVATVVLAPLLPHVTGQTPVNGVVSWPSGLLLLASILYAALGTAPDVLWNIEPSIGFFIGSGLPYLSIPTMNRVNWVAKACHFVPKIKTTYGASNFWIRTEEISESARSEALKKAMALLSPVIYVPFDSVIVDSWSTTAAGLLEINPMPSHTLVAPPRILPTAHDFLLFAAIHYHAFWEREVQVQRKGNCVFTTRGSGSQTIFEVDSQEMALPIVAAQMVRRPHSQSPLRGLAQGQKGNGPYVLDLESVARDAPACYIDFHSYAAQSSKVIATLDELAEAYYRVVQHIKYSAHSQKGSESHLVAQIQVGQTLWLSILGGAVLQSGRLTIQNLPGRWGNKDISADEAYLTRIEAVLGAIEPYANRHAFGDLVFSGGSNRRPAVPFLLASLFGQMIVCYFLSVGTSAGVWTSVALANSLYSGKLFDWHSLYYGKSAHTEEPGMKMYVPGSKDLMMIATFDRTSPREGALRPGFLLNAFGIFAAILGSIFQQQTRDALEFGPLEPCRGWVVYTSMLLTLGTSVLIALTLVTQQWREKTWLDDSELPVRWLAYGTLPTSLVVVALAAFFELQGLQSLWPILDALTWVSGIPFGVLESGRMVSVDDNVLHLMLVNRWLMGAVASAVGSSIH